MNKIFIDGGTYKNRICLVDGKKLKKAVSDFLINTGNKFPTGN